MAVNYYMPKPWLYGQPGLVGHRLLRRRGGPARGTEVSQEHTVTCSLRERR